MPNTQVVTDHHSPAARNQDDNLFSKGYWDVDCVLHCGISMSIKIVVTSHLSHNDGKSQAASLDRGVKQSELNLELIYQ